MPCPAKLAGQLAVRSTRAQQCLVVLPGIDVLREDMIYCHIAHPVGMRVQDLPGGLITTELTLVVKEFTRKDHRMAPTTTIRGQGNTATLRPPVLCHLVDYCAVYPGLIAEEYHHGLSAWVDSGHTGFVGAGAPFSEDRVDSDLGTCSMQPG